MRVTSVKATGWAQSFPISGGVQASRRWVRRHLDTLGWNEWAPDIADAVELTVSELVTNAHFHAHSTAQLVLVWDNRYLHVSVHDGCRDLPTTGTPDENATGGRGIVLVDALADAWGAQQQSHGKTVTASFHGPIPLRCDPPCRPSSGRDADRQ
ncbi:ATP-binding protein [Streptacidiphilus sp. PB12-B1b]|uniref:ATP-binding protein n=1 Tax=Streptacidiphilus sp. PB12-B1b TaxID=2705012 RepID=UPI0015F89C0A|nr:ATP-binding protein [Streptacidiphilus sp. PB12-B1b]QMU76769.1 ATP-binding protein [Streptacidiphilus sp. PB12-B1b]